MSDKGGSYDLLDVCLEIYPMKGQLPYRHSFQDHNMANSADNTAILARTRPKREVLGAVEPTTFKTVPDLSTLQLQSP